MLLLAFVSLPRPPKTLRAIGFDDAPFAKRHCAIVPIVGVVCAGTRFEGVVAGKVRKDGLSATHEVERLLLGGKFLPQIHLVLFDGVAFGGFNVIDLERLATTLKKPCVAVMRKAPDLAGVERVIRTLPSPSRRLAMLHRAGEVHARPPFFFQVRGGDPDDIGEALERLTHIGHVPEALRIAHMIGGAMVNDVSGRRA